MKVKMKTRSLAQTLARDWSKNKLKYIMILPVLIYLVLFAYKPMYGLIIAFKDYKITKGILESPWADPWYRYFLSFIQDPFFLRVIRNTFLISVYSLFFGFPAPILLALMINEVRNKICKRTVQTITYMPYFISLVVICSMIRVYCMQDGLFSQIGVFFGGTAKNYLMDPKYFRTIYIVSGIWQNIGWDSIVYLAAMSSIDQEQYEAARVDGASRLQQIFHITIPGLLPTITILFILRMGHLLGVGYEKILLLYNGSTMEVADVISTYTYRLTFDATRPMYSKSTAIGLFNTLINLCFLFLTNSICKKLSENENSLF